MMVTIYYQIRNTYELLGFYYLQGIQGGGGRKVLLKVLKGTVPIAMVSLTFKTLIGKFLEILQEVGPYFDVILEAEFSGIVL
jgi:hypothetical protein